MQTYLAHATPRNIGYLLIIAVALWGTVKMIIWYADRQPIQEALPRYPVNEQANVADILVHMGLRRPLPEVLKAEQQEWPIDPAHIDNLLRQAGASDAERADILRGTKMP